MTGTSRFLLVDGDIRCFHMAIALEVGLTEAIILQQVHYWLGAEKSKVIDGRHWMYNSIKGWRKQFPIWSERTIWQAINNLEEHGLLVSGNHNPRKGDRTKWYTIDYEQVQAMSERPTISQDLRDDFANFARPLPKNTSKEQAGLKKDQLGSGKQKKERASSNQPVADQPVKPDKPTSSGQLDITLATSVTQTVSLLAEAFSLKTGIPVPNPVSQRNWAAYNVRWGGPLRNLLNLCQTYGNTVTLMNKAIDRMRADKLTISAPQSIEQVAIAIYGENKGGRTGYW